jgi:UDP-N-acetylmuramate--alanine ligase
LIDFVDKPVYGLEDKLVCGFREDVLAFMSVFPSVSPDATSHPLVLCKTKPIHFVGVGGVGMSGLAKILLQQGFTVSGSDMVANAYTQLLTENGLVFHQGHHADHLPKINALVIVSTSINTTNPEIAGALAKQYPIYHRSELLKELLQGDLLHYQSVIGITGTHGKTTITGMTGVGLKAAGLNPTIIVGGKIPGLNTNAYFELGSQMAVAELDESDGTILQYQPTLSLISNLELDHADFYQDGLSGILATFKTYLNQLPKGSQVLFNMSCPTVKKLAEECPSHIEAVLLAEGEIFTGKESETTYWLKNARHAGKGCYQAYVYQNRQLLGELSMSVPGLHNLFNGLCAVASGIQQGATFEAIAPAIAGFTGMGRRFERVGTLNGAVLVDDYAHHPSEVSATLKAASLLTRETGGRVIAIFQPHRYTRLKALWQEFLSCFEQADQVVITDVYAASEEPIEGITSEAFVSKLSDQKLSGQSTCYLSANQEFMAIRQMVQQEARAGDIILSMGAGSITQLLRHSF